MASGLPGGSPWSIFALSVNIRCDYIELKAFMRLLLLLPLLLLASCTERSTVDAPTLVQKAGQGAASGQVSSPPVATGDASSEVAARLIKRYAATYDYDALLAEPAIKAKLEALLGPEYKRFTESMAELRSPIDVISGDLSVVGIKKGEELDEVALCVRFYPLDVQVGFFLGNQMTLYSHQPQYRFLSQCLQQWVFMRTTDKTGFSMPPKHGEGEFSFQYKVIPKP